MADVLKLMCILAHPDDETLAKGSILAKYAAEGVQTFLVVASRGERGWQNKTMVAPEPEEIAGIRVAELHAAAEVLGIDEITFLDFLDGQMDQADTDEAIAKIVAVLRRVRPQVVVTLLNGDRANFSFAQTNEQHLWESQLFYRAFSLVNGGRGVETDLFAGLRS